MDLTSVVLVRSCCRLDYAGIYLSNVDRLYIHRANKTISDTPDRNINRSRFQGGDRIYQQSSLYIYYHPDIK